MLDVLSDILSRLSVRGTLYFRTFFTPPYGVIVPPFENVARFHYAHRGDCAVYVPASGATIELKQGDLVIIPHGATHTLYSADVTPSDALPLDQVLEVSGYSGEGVLVYGGQSDTRQDQLICGHFSFAAGSHHLILDRLPPQIVVRNYGETNGGWLDFTLQAIGAETGKPRMGGDLVALKMSEAIFAQAVRVYLESDEAIQSGLSGFADPYLARALAAFHNDPSRDWTVGDLAREAGQSRTGFAQHFARKMDTTPMQYATSWRMQIARQALAEKKLSIIEAAELTGYTSEAAFSRVFKKEVGLPPAAYRASQNADAGANRPN